MGRGCAGRRFRQARHAARGEFPSHRWRRGTSVAGAAVTSTLETKETQGSALGRLSSRLLRAAFSPHRRALLVALPIVLAISVFYVFMASSGTFRDLRRQSHYATMAEGFDRGHLYVPRRPPRQLLEQEDPFHPSNKPSWIWDASLYQG